MSDLLNQMTKSLGFKKAFIFNHIRALPISTLAFPPGADWARKTTLISIENSISPVPKDKSCLNVEYFCMGDVITTPGN